VKDIVSEIERLDLRREKGDEAYNLCGFDCDNLWAQKNIEE